MKYTHRIKLTIDLDVDNSYLSTPRRCPQHLHEEALAGAISRLTDLVSEGDSLRVVKSTSTVKGA